MDWDEVNDQGVTGGQGHSAEDVINSATAATGIGVFLMVFVAACVVLKGLGI